MESKYYMTAEMLPITLRPKDVAKLLDVSIKYARSLFRDHTFPTIMIGERKLVGRTDFLAWLDSLETNKEICDGNKVYIFR